MSDGPSRIYLIIGGVVVAAIWVTAGIFAWRGTWWPLIVVGCIAGSALVVSMGMAMFVRGRSGGPPPAAAQVGRDAPPPRAAGQVGARGRGSGGKGRRRRKS